jgi:L-ascorbate metabolism protein UlaG (beta-lactamase superfamily)
MKSFLLFLTGCLPIFIMAQQPTDTYSTPLGKLEVTPVNHGSVMLQINGKVIHIDPYEKTVDYAKLPKADLILITHEHPDHLDKKALDKITKADTHVITTATVLATGKVPGAQVLKNGESASWNKINIEAVPAYNIIRKRPDGIPFHPKGVGNGYILSFGTFRLYIAGDTEFIPEMKRFGKLDVAFLPKNLPYTMTDEQFIEAAKVIRPKVLYPYHYFEIDRAALRKALPETIVLK